jgi:hypothetical protein
MRLYLQKEMIDDSTCEYHGYSSDDMSTDCDSDEEPTLDDIWMTKPCLKN